MVNIDNMINWVQFYSGRLPTVPKPAGDHKYNACCPFHQEKNPSFWFNTENGMWKCECGCGSGNATSFLARLEDISNQEAWAELCRIAGVDADEKPRQPDQPETLAHYSESKHLPMDYLQKLGMKDHPGNNGKPAYVTIPYYGVDGKCAAVKQRFNKNNRQRFGWDKGGTPTLYGLWREENQKARAVVLVEGESDAQTCWLNNIACYGVPGATNFQSAWVQFIGTRTVYIHVEPDSGGQKFRQKTLEKLKEAGFAGKVFTFSCNDIDAGCKDPSELFVRFGEQFREKLAAEIKKAKQEDLQNLIAVHEAKETAPQKKEVPPLEVYQASELYGKKIDAPPTIIRGMVPAGLTILAGAPKKGKSWMSLAMAIAVATGQQFLGMETQQGDVLYLDLESAQFRVQKRLEKLLVGPGPDRLWIAHKSERLDEGLLEQIQKWIETVEAPSLIIIDTFGRVDAGKRKGENAYQGDTRVLGEVQRFAIQRKLAILVVHHLRKVSGGILDDPLERVSGSMGLTGAADAVLLLDSKRGEEDATLSITSRDFEAQKLVVAMANGRWFLKSTNSEEYMEEQEYLKSDICRAVVKIAHTFHEWRGTSSDLLEELQRFGAVDVSDIDPRSIGNRISKFRDKLYDRESVVFENSKKGTHGKRFMRIMEVKTDGF